MLRASITFFVLALLAIVFGATGIAGVSLEIGKITLMVFLILAVISFIAAIFTAKRSSGKF